MRAHRFRGKVWRMVDRRPGKRVWADCDAPWERHKTIHAPLSGDTEGDLGEIIHEALHACFWDLGEDAVDKAADDIARLLWRLGWRKES